MYYSNQNIKKFYRIFDQNEKRDYLRLDLNKNPGGLLKEFIKRVLADVTPQFVTQYPETLHFTIERLILIYTGLQFFQNKDIQKLIMIDGKVTYRIGKGKYFERS